MGDTLRTNGTEIRVPGFTESSSELMDLVLLTRELGGASIIKVADWVDNRNRDPFYQTWRKALGRNALRGFPEASLFEAMPYWLAVRMDDDAAGKINRVAGQASHLALEGQMTLTVEDDPNS